jgi:hypothetical protein
MLSPKPNRTQKPGKDVEAFIAKGGTVAEEAEVKTADKVPQHPLKFHRPELFRRLEEARKGGAVELPRNTWILQAIAEKLDRESC